MSSPPVDTNLDDLFRQLAILSPASAQRELRRHIQSIARQAEERYRQFALQRRESLRRRLLQTLTNTQEVVRPPQHQANQPHDRVHDQQPRESSRRAPRPQIGATLFSPLNGTSRRSVDPPGAAQSLDTQHYSLIRFGVSTFGQRPRTNANNTIIVPDESHLRSDMKFVDTSNGICVICLENKAICAALPCGHLSYCVDCSRRMCTDNHGERIIGEVNCAHCRHEIHELKRIYM